MCNRIVIEAACAAWIGLGLAAAAPHERTFEFEYAATVKGIPAGAKQVEVWIPVPQSDDWQQIMDLRVESPYPHEMTVGAESNGSGANSGM